MKRKVLIFLTLCMGLGLWTSVSPSKEVHAAYDYITNNTKNWRGVTYQKFWVGYVPNQQPVNDSMYTWNSSNGTGIYTNMNMQRTDTQAASIMDFYEKTDPHSPAGLLGRTSNDGRTGDAAFSQNWGSSSIILYTMALNSFPASAKRWTAAHEIGHALGLMHNSGWGQNGSVMYPEWNYQPNLGPSIHDMKGVKYLYG